MEDQLIYVYCISDNHLQLPYFAGAENLKNLLYGKFSAIVKEVSHAEFSEENLRKNFADLPWIELHARDHIRIITEVMKDRAVIPFKFGTIFLSAESLGQFVADYADSLSENLNNTKGKEEWSVKIYVNKAILNGQIGVISQDVRNLENEIAVSMPGKAFLLKRKKVELIETEVQRELQRCGQSCYEDLSILSALTRLNNILPREVTERTDDMILNLSCFVTYEKIDQFLHVIDQLQEKYQSVGFDINAAGPWPPFSFTSIKEK